MKFHFVTTSEHPFLSQDSLFCRTVRETSYIFSGCFTRWCYIFVYISPLLVLDQTRFHIFISMCYHKPDLLFEITICSFIATFSCGWYSSLHWFHVWFLIWLMKCYTFSVCPLYSSNVTESTVWAFIKLWLLQQGSNLPSQVQNKHLEKVIL